MSELKPCPFCGGKAKNDLTEDHTELVGCVNIDCSENDLFEVAMWNNRPIEDALQRRLDIAVKALTEISNSTNEAYLTGGREMKRIASQAIAAWNEMNKVEVNDDKPE